MPDERPNILLITSDQHRADFLGCEGHPYLETPHLDRLALAGTRFTNAYADCPVCTPARTTLITGRRAHENGDPTYDPSLRVERPRDAFLGSLITAAGYQTELVGKTHWHTPTDFRAGFEHVEFLAELKRRQLVHHGRHGSTAGVGANELSPVLETLPPHLQSTDWIVDRSIDFLETRERSQPFFLWTSFTDPHPPCAVSEPFFSMYRGRDHFACDPPAWVTAEDAPIDVFEQHHQHFPGHLDDAAIRRGREVYAGLITYMDRQIGRLLGELAIQGDLDNTWIIYSSDHGECFGDFALRGKYQFMEPSARLPLIVTPPHSASMPRGVTRDAFVEWCDLLPTMCDVAGADAAVPQDVTGSSLVPLVRGEANGVRDFIHGQIRNAHMLRAGSKKLLYFADDGSSLAFDLDKDPGEREPLSAEETEPLRLTLANHLRETRHEDVHADGTLLNRNRPRPGADELRAMLKTDGLPSVQYLANTRRGIMHNH